MSYSQTFAVIAKFAIPCVFSNILFFLMQLTLLYFIGQNCGTVMAASIGMGIMLMNVLCLAFTQSFNGSLETFVTQTRAANQFFECGVSFNKHRLLLSLIFVPMVIIFYFCDSILIACAQDPEISLLARNYICCCLPGLFAIALFDARKRFLQSLLMSQISTNVQCVTVALHVFWCWLFIQNWQLELYGAAICLNITYISTYAI